MLQDPALQDSLQDSLVALARDSARALLQHEGVDLRYFPEAWFFLGLAFSIFAWCWRTWYDLHGAPVAEPAPAAATSAELLAAAARAGAFLREEAAPADPAAASPLFCPACRRAVGDTRSPLGYLTVCPSCGRPISVRVVEGRASVVIRE